MEQRRSWLPTQRLGARIGALIHRIREALHRARAPIAILTIAYAGPLVIGGVLATSGNHFARDQRNAIVGAAQGSEITAAYEKDDRMKAALLDSAGNVEAALITSVTGLAVVVPLPIAAYRGWVGGIVSIDAQGRSRLRHPGPAFYYVVTLVLQSIPYILTSGAGTYLGLAAWRSRNNASIRPLLTLRIPGEAIRDVGWIWGLALPVFLAGSLFEFLV